MNRRYFLSTFLLYIANLSIPSKVFAQSNTLPKVGSTAPQFKLPGYSKNPTNEKLWSLENFNNSWIVLYFYPKDFTKGCSIEAKGFQDKYRDFKRSGTEVIGISTDSEDKHESFCNSENLDFLLLSDTEGLVSKQYGSWNQPFSARNTFLIDPKGIIRERWIGVKPINHANIVYKTLVELKKS